MKLSSLGDVIHTYPALHDLKTHYPEMTITWVVEEAFAPLVALNPEVDAVIAVPMRRLSQHKFWWLSAEWRDFMRRFKASPYDAAIDAQGLIKSALLMRVAKAKCRIGLDRESAREGLASCFYQEKIPVAGDKHAIWRTRELFARAFHYEFAAEKVSTGLVSWQGQGAKELLFIHGTTWASKLLPEKTWHVLIAKAVAAGYAVSLTWGNETERLRAERLARGVAHVTVLPKLTLPELQNRLQTVAGAISVDTGLGHLAAALGVPVLGVFGPTDARLTGLLGERADNLSLDNPCMEKNCARHGGASPQACMAKWSGDDIWQKFIEVMGKTA